MREELPAISPGQIQSRGPPKAKSWPASARERAKTGPQPEGPPGREQRKQPVPSFSSQLRRGYFRPACGGPKTHLRFTQDHTPPEACTHKTSLRQKPGVRVTIPSTSLGNTTADTPGCIPTLSQSQNTMNEITIRNERRISLGVQWLGIHLPIQRTQVRSLMGKNPHATEQLRPCTTPAEPVSYSQRSAAREWPPLATTTGGGPRAARGSQNRQE